MVTVSNCEVESIDLVNLIPVGGYSRPTGAPNSSVAPMPSESAKYGKMRCMLYIKFLSFYLCHFLVSLQLVLLHW